MHNNKICTYTSKVCEYFKYCKYTVRRGEGGEEGREGGGDEEESGRGMHTCIYTFIIVNTIYFGWSWYFLI